MTKNARIILDIVTNSCNHPTAEEIFMNLKKQKNKMVLATVYNNLNMLCAKGLIRRIFVDGVSDRYDNITRHDHIYCQSCGKITDVIFEDLTEDIEKKLGIKIISYDLQINYLCPECMEKQKKIVSEYENSEIKAASS